MKKSKGNKSFMMLTKKECIEASIIIQSNADNLYNDAKILANNKSYGHATSLLIHSTEESMKAFILFLDGNGFQFRNRVDGISNLFVNHKLRYGLAMLLSILHIFSEDIKQLIPKIVNSTKLTFDFVKDKEQLGDLLLKYIQTRIKTVILEVSWFSKAEFFRQDGFYVDYIDEIKTPLQIKETDFKAVLLRIDGLRSFLHDYIKSFDTNDKKILKGIENLKEQFISENWYEKIAKVIELFKDKKLTIKKVVEIGVQTGASLRMWRDFFPKATIFGADINKDCLFEEDGIKTFLCDQTKAADLKKLIKKIGKDIDIFIEDGSHNPDVQVFTCLTVMPLLSKKALYVIEDVGHKEIAAKLSMYNCEFKRKSKMTYVDDRLLLVRNV